MEIIIRLVIESQAIKVLDIHYLIYEVLSWIPGCFRHFGPHPFETRPFSPLQELLLSLTGHCQRGICLPAFIRHHILFFESN